MMNNLLKKRLASAIIAAVCTLTLAVPAPGFTTQEVYAEEASSTDYSSVVDGSYNIYFVNNDNWSGDIRAYLYDNNDINNKNGQWPGAEMTKVGTVNGKDVYAYNLPSNLIGKAVKVIFTNGSQQFPTHQGDRDGLDYSSGSYLLTSIDFSAWKAVEKKSETTEEETKSSETTTEETKSSETTTEEPKSTETTKEETKPAESKTEETKPEEEAKPAETTKEETKPAGITTEETKPAETTKEETKPAETTKEETKPAETTEETKPAETTTEETKPAETTKEETKPAETTQEETGKPETTQDDTKKTDATTDATKGETPKTDTKKTVDEENTGEIKDLDPASSTFDVDSDDSKDDENAVEVGDELTSKNAIYTVTAVGDDNTVEYSECISDSPKKVVIPDSVTIDGTKYNVTSIGTKALTNIKTITAVSIGKNVTTIGKKAFYGCRKLKQVVVTSTSLAQIKSRAFKKINSSAIVLVPKAKASVYKKLFRRAGILSKKIKVISTVKKS